MTPTGTKTYSNTFSLKDGPFFTEGGILVVLVYNVLCSCDTDGTVNAVGELFLRGKVSVPFNPDRGYRLAFVEFSDVAGAVGCWGSNSCRSLPSISVAFIIGPVLFWWFMSLSCALNGVASPSTTPDEEISRNNRISYYSIDPLLHLCLFCIITWKQIAPPALSPSHNISIYGVCKESRDKESTLYMWHQECKGSMPFPDDWQVASLLSYII